jgi:hypothetical protein
MHLCEHVHAFVRACACICACVCTQHTLYDLLLPPPMVPCAYAETDTTDVALHSCKLILTPPMLLCAYAN